MSSRKGLPFKVRMRHDSHFVEALAARNEEGVGRLIPIDRIEANPGQPRTQFGDIDSLVASVEKNGILEPILVRQLDGDRYQIIAGERRYRAAIQAGLAEVPCIEMEATDQEALELALVENLQRLDLDPFEEADGYRQLNQEHAYTHNDISRLVGKSRSWITETVSLAKVPDDVRELCRHADLRAKSVLLQLLKCDGPEEMKILVANLTGTGMTRDDLREKLKAESAPKAGRPKNYSFNYKPKGSSYALSLSFKKSQVPKEEIVQALRDLISKLEANEIEP